jgi:hypothetical protein
MGPVDRAYVVSTPLTDFDSLGFPDNRTESGWNGRNTQAVSRTFDFTYYHSSSPWVVGQLATVTLAGKTILRDYHASSAMLKTLDEYGVVENYYYFSSGDLRLRTWIREGVAHENRFTDYKLGTPTWDITQVDPSDSTQDIWVKREVDDIGRLKLYRDGESDFTYYSWDEGRRLKTIDTPTQSDVLFNYVIDGSTGLWDQTTVVQGAYKRTIDLDGFGRVRHSREEDTVLYSSEPPRAKSYSYDAAGRLGWETAHYDWTSGSAYSSAPKILYSYDEFDRVTQVVNVNGSDTVVICHKQSCNTGDYSLFDATLTNGEIVTDEEGYQTGYEYRSYGHPDNRELTRVVQQISKSTDPGGATWVVTRINRDPHGNITRVRQGDGSSGDLSRDYAYNSKLQLWRVTNPETGITEFTYDEVGNRKTSKVGASDVTTYFYDGANRMTGIVYPDDTPSDPNDEKLAPDVSFDYYMDSLVRSAGHDRIKWNYEYTPEGLVTIEELDVDTLSYFLENTYDSNGTLNSIFYPAGNEITFSPDGLGRPRQVKDAGLATAYVSNVEYWPDDTVKSMDMGNGAKYTSTRTARLFPDVLRIANGSTPVVRLDYDTNARGNVSSITDTVFANNNRTMQYDGLNRLVEATGHWGTGAVSYDRVGNIAQKTMGPGGAMIFNTNATTNLLTSVSGPASRTYSYDAYGNVSADGTFTFTYNSASELVNVPTGLAPGITLDYRYDANSKRTVERRGSDTSYHGYNQAGKLMFSMTCTADEAEQFYYLDDMLVARETMPCLQGCHPSQE